MALWGLAVPMRTALKKTHGSESCVGTQDSSLVLPNVFFHVHFKCRFNQQWIEVLHIARQMVTVWALLYEYVIRYGLLLT